MVENSTPKKILLVDDNSDVLTVFEFGLQTIGYEAILCSNGAQAVEAFELHKPRVVLIDFRLPDMNGIEVGRALKKLDSQNVTTFALLTGADGDKLRDEATNAGIQTILHKPLGVNKLNQWVQEIESNSQDQTPLDSP